jgi:hypothetical protein
MTSTQDRVQTDSGRQPEPPELTGLSGDFYGFETLLTPQEREIVASVRRFAEDRIARSPTMRGSVPSSRTS